MGWVGSWVVKTDPWTTLRYVQFQLCREVVKGDHPLGGSLGYLRRRHAVVDANGDRDSDVVAVSGERCNSAVQTEACVGGASDSRRAERPDVRSTRTVYHTTVCHSG